MIGFAVPEVTSAGAGGRRRTVALVHREQILVVPVTTPNFQALTGQSGLRPGLRPGRSALSRLYLLLSCHVSFFLLLSLVFYLQLEPNGEAESPSIRIHELHPMVSKSTTPRDSPPP